MITNYSGNTDAADNSQEGMMAKIVVDKDTCTAHARRNLEAPDLFPLDDDGFVTVTARAIDDSQKPATELAIAACPERALRMETGDPS